MTDQRVTVYNRSTALLAADSESDIKAMTRKIMHVTPAGGKLTADQAVDLAVYALMTGLNPFNNECFYMDKVGCVPGIAGYRSKALDFLQLTNPNPRFSPRVWEEYRPATQEEANFDPDAGDVAWVCTLYDSISREQWESKMVELSMKFKDMGATFTEAYEAAKHVAGDCPSWTAVGVVKASEHFSGKLWVDNKEVPGQYKPEMWDRNERAKKRAAKGCFRKGFPKMNLPDAEEGDVIDGEYTEVKQKIVEEMSEEDKAKAAEPKRPASDIIGELYGEKPKSAVVNREDVDPETGEIVDPKPAAPAPANNGHAPEQADKHEVFDGPDPLKAKWPADAPMTYNTAAKLLDSKGVRYVDIPTGKVDFVLAALAKRVNNQELPDEARAEAAQKFDALTIIRTLI